ncbi:hypothetical protein CMU78_05890 [Elizabethkingia anophelis]|uniref:hypothetical protein n=1 Tax=Elizabethkingia sp. M8 TaxID=2796140 RepID=UPI0019032AC1|nr:hypothetical protein [Elizabethkingia sp. M8]MCT3630168.1 hypothetical protein [Elizabethkingia anophelis]MCT3633682.1 hypothetical protein [Elizabethkingia anophelis]MCT3727854.1 hypothetical protein [Elizabethkingia anophelis]MCT3830385.1 hypothetical protein [Elizabethkingia anophelis]MCT3883886.1 hypothetical protein [Elizabethkingia anophelis]
MNKTILFFLSMLLLTIISCSRSNDDSSNNNRDSMKLDNTNWSGIFSSYEMKIMTNNIIAIDNEKVQIQFSENNTFKLYGYGKSQQNQWIVNSGPYKGTYTYSSNGTIKLNYESGATFNSLNSGYISNSIMTISIGNNQFKFNKE